MKIETRFDVGQEVAYLDREPHRCAKCGQVTPGGSYTVRVGAIRRISCQVGQEVADNGSIWYHTSEFFVPENDVFGTSAEAEAEAERRNKEDE